MATKDEKRETTWPDTGRSITAEEWAYMRKHPTDREVTANELAGRDAARARWQMEHGV